MVLDTKPNKKTRRFVIIGLLIGLLALTFFFKKIMPSKLGSIFSQLDSKAQKTQINTNQFYIQNADQAINIDESHNVDSNSTVDQMLCGEKVIWPTQDLILKKIFPQNNFEKQLISENIFYKKVGLASRIVRKTNSEIILFQEDSDGFPSPVSLDDSQDSNSQVLRFIVGYQKDMVQRLIEYSNSESSLVLNIEDQEVTQIQLNTDKIEIECEDQQCQCSQISN